MNIPFTVGTLGLGAALVGLILHAGEEPPETPLQAVYELYHTESDNFDINGTTAVQKQAFFREWHDRLAAVAAQSDDDDPAKYSVLATMTTLAVTVGDTPAAIAAAEQRAALPGTAPKRADAAIWLAGVHRDALEQNPTPAELSNVAAVQDATLALYEAVPAEDRRGSLAASGIQFLLQAADVRARLDRHGAAAERLGLAVSELDRNFPEGAHARTLLGEMGETNYLLNRRAVEEVAAGDDAAATASVTELVGDGTVPASAVVFKVANGAGLGDKGGTFLLNWLAEHPADDYTPRVKAALAFALDDAGRDVEALPLLLELREQDAAALAPLKAGVMDRPPYATVLYRLEKLLRDEGATELAKEVEADYRRRYPKDPRRGMIGRDVTFPPLLAPAAETPAELQE